MYLMCTIKEARKVLFQCLFSTVALYWIHFTPTVNRTSLNCHVFPSCVFVVHLILTLTRLSLMIRENGCVLCASLWTQASAKRFLPLMVPTAELRVMVSVNQRVETVSSRETHSFVMHSLNCVRRIVTSMKMLHQSRILPAPAASPAETLSAASHSHSMSNSAVICM